MIHEYAQKIRRELHMQPEIGFDLDNTLKVVRRELDTDGIEYVENFGKSSIVATINPEKAQYTIGIRADMDALPITEENDVEYKSRVAGKMHACGHDAHTAMLLAVAKELNEIKDKINCRVKFIFQAAEEGLCGSRLLVADGVMKDIDEVIALHVEPKYDIGTIGLSAGAQTANSDRMTIDFTGKNAHAIRQHLGADAILMGVRAYNMIEQAIAKEVDPTNPVIFNAGEFHGGTAANIIADRCHIACTLRTWDGETEKRLLDKMEAICKMSAEISGGTSEFKHTSHYPAVINDEAVTKGIYNAAAKVIGEENIKGRARGMGGEDFAYYANEKPGCMFFLGVANEEKGTTIKNHNPKFNIDEDCLQIGIDIFKQYVLDNMNKTK